MAKYDEQLGKMLSLMEDNTVKKAASNVWYHTTGADGKVYGIVKEGTKFYIKKTVPGKETISESYDYLKGFNNRRENEYRSYNDATKHLELEMMAINEQYGKHEDVSTVDFHRNEKNFATLTEEARKELNRMHQIYENSCKIGRDCVCDPESKGKSTGDQTEKNNDPFSNKTNASLDKDPKFKGTVEGATDEYDNVSKDVDSKLQHADKMEKGGKSLNDFKDTHDDLDGEGVADKKPSGGKAVVVNVNEGLEELNGEGDITDVLDQDVPVDGAPADVPEPIETPVDGTLDAEETADADVDTLIDGDELDNEEVPTEEPVADVNPDTEDIAGLDDVTLDSLLEELENAAASKITGPDAILDKEKNPINGTDNGVGNEETMDRIDEDGNVNEPTKQGDENTLKNYQYGYNKEKKLGVQSWDKMNEAVAAITNDVYRRLTESKKPAKRKETLQEAIDRIVKEEVTRLNVWGKHPKFRKEPMTTPANKEVLAGTADRDWNDDSAKGEQPYGLKIGKGDPFDKIVDLLTDQVMSQLKEGKNARKK